MNMSEMLQNIEIIFCSINFIDKMRSWISKMCWVSTWFGRIYVLREIYRARRKLDRLIIRDYPNKPACGGSLQSSSFFANVNWVYCVYNRACHGSLLKPFRIRGGEGGEEEEGGETSPMCESIGHWPLRGLCPKGERQRRRKKERIN